MSMQQEYEKSCRNKTRSPDNSDAKRSIVARYKAKEHAVRISSREEDNDVLFIISEFSPEYKEIFENAYYSLENGCYTKRFPKDTPNISRIRENWENCAEEMFAQMGYFQTARWEEALLGFINRIRGHDIHWWLTGSCATCVRGVDIQPHDVDIMMRSEDIYRVNQLFSDCIVEPIICSKGWVVANFGVLFMGARLDWAFDPEDFVDNPDPTDFGPYAMQNLEDIDWKGQIVRIPPLELQMQVNKRRGRDDRVAAIEKFLICRSR